MLPVPGTPPPAEVSVDAALVRRLLTEQQPDLAALDVALVAEGWDNVMFRLGGDMLVRLPRRALAANLVVHEQTWLPRLAPSLSIPIPAPIRCGRPAAGYPWHWSVLPWIPGTNALETPLHDSQARQLGRFLSELHAIDLPREPPHNPYRGGPLADRRETDAERLQRLAASGV
ncbi:MAG: phosphotransferase, partial [Acidimicrobiia bacterium]